MNDNFLSGVLFGQKHNDFEYSDYESIKKIQRLAKRHHRQCENSCNGYGIVNGQIYYAGMSHGQEPGDYEKKEYGYSVKPAYMNEVTEDTIFDTEIDKIQDEIISLVKTNKKFKVEFQHDPRGWTVKLFYQDSQIVLF